MSSVRRKLIRSITVDIDIVEVSAVIKKDPSKFTIPADLLKHPELVDELSGVVTSQLSRARGNIKQKVRLFSPVRLDRV